MKFKVFRFLLIAFIVYRLIVNWDVQVAKVSDIKEMAIAGNYSRLFDTAIGWRVTKGDGDGCTDTFDSNPGGWGHIYDDSVASPFYDIVGEPKPGMNKTGIELGKNTKGETVHAWWYSWKRVLIVEVQDHPFSKPITTYRHLPIKAGENLHLKVMFGTEIFAEMCFLAGEYGWVAEYSPHEPYTVP